MTIRFRDYGMLEDWPITTGLDNLSFYKCFRVEGMNSQCEIEQM